MVGALSAIDKIAFSLGSLEVRWYGLIIVCAMILGLVYLIVEGKRIGLKSDDGVELFLWIIPMAIVFARIFYVVVRPGDYFPWKSWSDFVAAIAIWDGGITIIGGVFGGLIGLSIFSYRKRKRVSVGQIIDLAVPPLLFGQILGRLGNFINQEAFGVYLENPKFHRFPFGVYIESPSGIEAGNMHLYKGEGWYAATCFYEMGWNIIGLGIAYAIWRKNKKYAGLLFFFYLIWYSLGRGLMEYIRLDAVPITQVLCFTLVPIALVFGVLYLFYKNSNLSFHKVNSAITGNLLYVTELTERDVKNYKFVSKHIKNPKNVLRFFYHTKDFKAVDLESLHYLEATKMKKPKSTSKIKKEN